MQPKTTGYLLLTAGVIVMLGALVEVLLVFTGNLEPIHIVSLTAPTLDINSLVPGLPGGTSDGGMELLPAKELNFSINLGLTLFLMGFVLSFGYKIASLGVMLVRPISVTLKEDKITQ